MSTERVRFPSGRLILEGIVEIPEGKGTFPAVVMCHPHPLYGGDMYDTVVVSIAKSLGDKGIATLRFNFRGVGESEGEYGGGIKERQDAANAIDYVLSRSEIAVGKIGLAGYSFGGGVAFNVALKDSRVRELALISPVIPDSGWKRFGVYSRPKLLVIGDSDEYFPLTEYGQKITDALKPEEYAIFPATSHLWDNNLNKMAERVAGFFAGNLI